MDARLVAALALVSTPLFPPRVFAQTGVEQVRVEVRVTDDRANPVTNLQPSDFEVVDEGTRQVIAAFTFVGAPLQTTATTSTTGADPAALATGAAGASGRRVVAVLDDLHIAATNTPRVKDSVRTFIATVLSAADSVAVVFTSGASGGGQEFTDDRRLVLDAVDRFRGQKLRSATVERINDPLLNLHGVLQPNADPNQAERANRARISLEALEKVAEALVPFEGQRPIVLFVSEGPEYEVTEQPQPTRSDQFSINRSIRPAIEALNRAGATVFAIDPRGVSAGNADQIYTSSIFEKAGVGTAAIQRENIRALGVVQAVAATTGGVTMLWRPNMSRDFRRVAVASSSYYVISYDAPATNRGAYHSIGVRVRKRGVQVNARSGYFLPAGPATPTSKTP